MTVTPFPTKRKKPSDSPSDASLASAFVDAHCQVIRYDATEDAWYLFDGAIWRRDQTNRASALMLDIIGAHGVGSATKLRNAMRLAMLDSRIVVTRDTWDTDPYLLGTPTAVYDLRTGQ